MALRTAFLRRGTPMVTLPQKWLNNWWAQRFLKVRLRETTVLHLVVPVAGANFWDAGLQHTGHVFKAGKKYTLSAFCKCKQGTLTINFKPELGQDPWTGYGEQPFTMTDEWVEYSVTTPVFATDTSPGNLTFHIAYTPAISGWIT